MSVWRKCATGPEFPVQCARCRRTIIVPGYAVMAAAVPGLGFIGLLSWSSPWSIVGGIAGVVTYVTLHHMAIPLRRFGFDPRFDKPADHAPLELPPPPPPLDDRPAAPPQ